MDVQPGLDIIDTTDMEHTEVGRTRKRLSVGRGAAIFGFFNTHYQQEQSMPTRYPCVLLYMYEPNYMCVTSYKSTSYRIGSQSSCLLCSVVWVMY